MHGMNNAKITLGNSPV